MAEWQIATGTSGGWTVNISVIDDTDPDLDISLIIREVNEISGSNSLEIPVGHLPSEYQVHLVDYNNALRTALESYTPAETIVHIFEGAAGQITGNGSFEALEKEIYKSAPLNTLVVTDGFKLLRTNILGEQFWNQKKTFVSFFTDILSECSFDLEVYINIGVLHDDADGTGLQKLPNHRFDPYRLAGYDKTINLFDLLIRFCEEFELTIFQAPDVNDSTKTAWYIVDTFERAPGSYSLYKASDGSETVIGTHTITKSSFRNPDRHPVDYGLPSHSPIIKLDIDPDYDYVRNPRFINWADDNEYPLDWYFEDSDRFSRNLTPTPNLVASQEEGLLLEQFVPVPVSEEGSQEIEITIAAYMEFFERLDETGDLTIGLARIFAITPNFTYGFNQDTGEFETTGDGWIYTKKTYPAESENRDVFFNETVTLPGLTANLYIQVWYSILLQEAGAVRVRPIYSQADVKFTGDPEFFQREYLNSTTNQPPVLERPLYLRPSEDGYVREDIEIYNSASDWHEAPSVWADSKTRIQLLNARRVGIWAHKVKIIEGTTGKNEAFNIEESQEIELLGTTYNTMMLRKKRSAKATSQNQIRILQVEESA